MSVLWYPSNIINYLRILSIFIMFYNIKRYPILCFFISLFGGLIDLIDGPIARYTLYTSKFGYFLDVAMDRLTVIILYIFLSRLYTKYWHVFCLLVLIEFTRDLTTTIINYNSILLHFINLIQDSTNTNDLVLKLKYDLYSNAGLKTDAFLINTTLKESIEVEDLGIGKFLTEINLFLMPFTWYLSDLFFWFIYCGAFAVTVDRQQQQHLVDDNNNEIYNCQKDSVILVDDYNIYTVPLMLVDMGSSTVKRNCFKRLLWEIQYSFKFVIKVFDSIGILLNDFIIKIILNNSKINFLKNFINFKIIFRLFGLICYFFTIYRFYLNFYNIFCNIKEILLIDYKYNSILSN